MWKSTRFCQVADLLSFSHLGFHLIKVYIYVKHLIHWMCQWSEYTLIIYMYALIIYIRILYVFLKKKSISIYIYIYISKNLMWESMRFCQLTHLLSFSHLGFHIIKVYIYVKLLIYWMCQWSEYTLIIYKYAIYIYIHKNFIWFFF